MLRRLTDAGYSIRVHTIPRPLREDEVAEMLPGVRGWICGTDRFSRKALAAADRLEILARSGVGYDAIDVEACNELGIAIATTPGANNLAVAEFSLGLVFALARELVWGDKVTRRRKWERGLTNGHSPLGKMLGIVGFGAIGATLAKLALGVGMRVQYYDALGSVTHGVDAKYVEFEELLRTSDYVSLHVPLAPETQHLISTKQLRTMKPSAYLINTSRCPIVDEVALCEALRERRIAGAALDVFEREPIDPNSPLFDFEDRLIMTPHLAGVSEESKTAMLRMAIDNTLAILAGETPPTIVNHPKKVARR
ncbi:MAG: phosphoglycerate dehydrogenase [Polyangiaceae bacterium]